MPSPAQTSCVQIQSRLDSIRGDQKKQPKVDHEEGIVSAFGARAFPGIHWDRFRQGFMRKGVSQVSYGTTRGRFLQQYVDRLAQLLMEL